LANEELEIKNGGPVSEEEVNSVRIHKKGSGIWPRLISLLLAIILWLCVMEVNPPTVYKTYEDVPITVMGVANLDVVAADGGELSVDVTVAAKKNQIGLLDERKIRLYIDTALIQEAGTYSLEVKCVLPNGYEVYKLSSETITVTVTLGTETP